MPDFPLLIDKGTPFAAEARRGLTIFKRLHVPDMPGTPLLGEACRPWFFAIVEALFGSYDIATNRRMINEFFVLIPKKNGKTSYGSSLMLTAVLTNRRPHAEFQLIAPTKAIADYAYKQIRQTIDMDADLRALFHTQDHVRTISYRHPKFPSVLFIKAADTDTVTGGKQVGTLIDETHEFAKKARAADIFLELKGALAARTEGFVLQITTQSKDIPAGVFRQELDVARAVRDGRLIQPLLPVLYEMPEALRATSDWRKAYWWPRLNPNFGASVDEAFLTDGLAKAEFKGQEEVRLFASAHFNVEIGLGLKSDNWPGARYWEANGDATLTLEAILDRCDTVTVGGDGGGLDDLLGLCVLGRDRATRQWLCWVHAWAHRDVLELRKSEASRLLDFEACGDLTIVDDLTDAFVEFAEIVSRVNDLGILKKVGLDPAGVKIIVDEMTRLGVTEEAGLVEGVSQGYKLQGVIKSVEVMLESGKLLHAAQPLMAWCVGNCKIKVRGNAVMVEKQASGTGKIDPVMALYDASAIMLNVPEQHILQHDSVMLI